jgi:cellobiose transport system substrate-binding protein
MIRRSRRRVTAAVLATFAATGLMLTGPFGSSVSLAAAPTKVQLSWWGFGDTGLEPLIKEYEKAHPGLTVKIKNSGFDDHHQALQTALASGSVPDIAVVEVGYSSLLKANSKVWTDLRKLGADKIKANYLDWRWEHGVSPDGVVMGIPTDVGGLAVAYRTDLFEKAGLPTNRDEVSKLWPTWEKFIETGQKFVAATSGKPRFIDSSGTLFETIAKQGPNGGVFTKDGKVSYETSTQVKRAWDVTTSAISGKLSANLANFSPEWNAGMGNGDFGVLMAPSWMMGYIQSQAKATSGKWDIAAIPEAGGNWGGSQLGIPAKSKHAKEAYELITWLLAPAQELRTFKANGNFPAVKTLYKDPALIGLTNPFFSNAPVGKIYADVIQKVTPIFEGKGTRAIFNNFQGGLKRVEDGKETPDQAWQTALKAIKKDLG